MGRIAAPRSASSARFFCGMLEAAGPEQRRSAAVTGTGRAMRNGDVPAHIAQVIVTPRAYARRRELLSAFRLLRARSPVARVAVSGFDPFWVVTKHADILEVSRKSEIFRNGDRATALLPQAADRKARSIMGGSPHLIRTLV